MAARTKAAKQRKAGKIMREFAKDRLHSGSKQGPVVTDPAQAKAIAMTEAGLSRKKRGRS